MDSRISTNTLMKRLFKASNLDSFLEGNEDQLQVPDFCGQLKQFCTQKGLTPAEVIERSQIERTYGYQLFNGTRRPSRDKVLQLSVGLELEVSQAQLLLRSAGKSLLYPRLRRDAVILYGLSHSLSVFEIQELLLQQKSTLLGGQHEDGQ